jgi:hypothetical protein
MENIKRTVKSAVVVVLKYFVSFVVAVAVLCGIDPF